MKKAAIYARFSTDLQNDRSNADQIAFCRDYARRAGSFDIVGTFEDCATSGASIENRPGIKRLMQAVWAGAVEVVIAESTSRISRDQEDRAAFRKLLRFNRVAIMTPADGEVTDLTDGIRAVIDTEYLTSLAAAVWRGQRGRTMEGLVAGGRCYGYLPVKGEPGKRVIVEAEAAVIRRIFAEYLAGSSPRQIAHGLNADGIAPPRGRSWRASTINGNTARMNGILRNSIYAGKIVWNRVRMVKHPDNANRVSQPNRPEDWLSADVPDLAIVSQAQFAAVQKRKADLTHVHPGRQKRPKRMLSGLLRCGCCGAGMSASGQDSTRRTRIRCSAAKEGGTCPAPKTFYLEVIETTVLDKLRGELSHPDAIAEYVRGYHEEHRRLAQSAGARRAKIERRMGEIDREIARLVDAIAKGHGDPAVLGPKSSALDAERKGLTAELSTIEEPKVIALHPAALARYEQSVARLQAAIGGAVSGGDAEATEAMRELIETVTVHRTAAGAAEVVITGRLNSLIGLPAFPSGTHSLCRKVVAGEGLEPPTSGL